MFEAVNLAAASAQKDSNLTIEIREQNPGKNRIIVDQGILKNGNGKIEVEGIGNIIDIGPSQECSLLNIWVAGHDTIRIGQGSILNGLDIYLFAPGEVRIGEQVSFNGRSRILIHETANITIGSKCLIAQGCTFSTSHMHKIFDVQSGERINPAGDVVLEEHVWFAEGVSCWGGSYISRDSVVGHGTSISKKKFPANSLIAGVPARLQREGIFWEH